MNPIITLLKREYWENRASFLYTPIVIGSIFIFLFLLTIVTTWYPFGTQGTNIGSLHLKGMNISGLDFLASLSLEFENLDLQTRQQVWRNAYYSLSSSFTLVLMIISSAYLLGALYDDRKDGSILFWKSLPVSDLMTVISKIITVLFIIPAFFIAATSITFIVIMIIASMVALLSGTSLWTSIWEPAPYLVAPFKLYFTFIIQSLWAAPLFGWMLLVSSWAKRKPMLIASVPIVVIVFFEFYFYRSGVFINGIQERIQAWMSSVDILRDSGGENVALEAGYLMGLPDYTYSILSLSDFWYGIAVAALMVTAAVYIRRFRDDS